MRTATWRRLAPLALTLLWTACSQGDPGEGPAQVAESAAYVPGPADDWAEGDPGELGFSPPLLDSAVAFALAHETSMPVDLGDYLRDRFSGLDYQEIVGPTQPRGTVNGILLKDGLIVAEWGDTRRVDMTFSVTKSFLSTVGGLAWDRGMLGDLDDPVRLVVDDGGYDGPQNRDITWRQTFQQTSEWEGTLFGKPDQADRREGVDRELHPPGTFWEYNDVRVNRAALSLLRVWNEPLPQVLDREIMDPIGASDGWRWHGYETSYVDQGGERIQSVSGGGHWGGGMFISTRDLARFGLLFLREGRWGDTQLVSTEWVREARVPSIEPTYGFMWWLNTDQGRFPSAPESSFFALGAASTSTIWIDPDRDIVLVSRWVDGPDVDGLIGRVLAAYAAGSS